ncbi:hypothetical protein MZK49_27915 [Ensifer sesbaniae]|jgi:hypothetical protein|nr:hypothetical protein [Ensifer sesbaniae]MCK3780517.1 hypothetical protein [Ensifer sesbaniae]NRQ17664.1 hypothetical protein [Ensifer sesbaniae]
MDKFLDLGPTWAELEELVPCVAKKMVATTTEDRVCRFAFNRVHPQFL